MSRVVQPYPIDSGSSRRRLVLVTFVVTVLLWHPRPVNAAASPFLQCQRARYAAAAKYNACQQKVLAKLWISNDAVVYSAAHKCAGKYRATWAKLVAKFAGKGSITCEGPRFVDNGNGTVTDRLTALQWEKKTDDSTVHDQDNQYRWKAGFTAGPEGDGTLFTTFFATLNGGGCFAATCDWRLPTLSELQTILEGSGSTCSLTPCIDPVFGPTIGGFYWSGTDFGDPFPDFAWTVFFQVMDNSQASKTSDHYVRAVRAGF